MSHVMRILAAAALAVGLLQTAAAADKEVVFFPSTAAVGSGGDVTVGIQGRVFEQTEHSLKRRLLVKMAAGAMQVKHGDLEESAIFRARLGAFVSDSGGSTHVAVKIGERTYKSPLSDSAGYFRFDVKLPKGEAQAVARNGTIPFQSMPGPRRPSTASGNAVLVPEEGITVVTDVDDTIKVTNMLEHKEKLRNTFLRPFQEVAGMPQLYTAWKNALGPNTQFHVVSAGPWHLHSPLAAFFAEKGFPSFTWDMRSIDATNPFIWPNEFTPQARKFKVARITALICRFPKRQLVLVGDSGELDPEVYSDIATQFPTHVSAIYIRDMKKPGQSANRFKDLFAGELAAKFRLFNNPAELPPPPSWSRPVADPCT
jgi:phosphatidate phosphatase APP1